MTATNLYATVLESDSTALEWYAQLIATPSSLDFDLCSPFPVQIDYRRAAVSTPSARTFAGRRTTWTEGDLRVFRMRWSQANMADAARVKSLWGAAGRTIAMNYTPPGGTATLVRFAMPSLQITRRNAVSYSFGVELEEVR